MKNNFLTGLTRLGVFAIGITGAFMTTAMGVADSQAFVNGHIQTGNPLSPCALTSEMCDTNVTSDLCRSGVTQVYQLTAPNTCTNLLWKIEP